MAKENREHKSGVFTDLFGRDETAKQNLLELYNALYGSDYSDPEMIGLVGLEDVLFQNFKNDVAFTVGKRKIILSEHQSTINPNMPLRDLMYIAREYEKIIPVRARYKTTLVKIPTPQFIVFYNGVKDYPDEWVLNLADSFYESCDPALNLSVRVININPQKKHDVLKKCRVLREYSQFVDTTRKYREDENQLEKAVRECIENGILSDYLKRKSYEVVNMLMAEYDYEMDMEVKCEEAAERAAKEAEKKADRKFVEYVENIAKNLHLSVEDACKNLEESYERYLRIKKSLQ